MDSLEKYHSVDIEWGNHDILWMGASIGSKICISGVITNSVRHNNLNILEDIYGINLRPLANYAEKHMTMLLSGAQDIQKKKITIATT